MKSKMTTNSCQQLNLKKQKQKQSKQTTRTGTESQKWRSHGGLSVGGGGGRMGEKLQGIRSINWQVQNRQGEVKNSMGNGKAKDFICMTHGHQIRERMLVGGQCKAEGEKGEETNGTTVIA